MHTDTKSTKYHFNTNNILYTPQNLKSGNGRHFRFIRVNVYIDCKNQKRINVKIFKYILEI